MARSPLDRGALQLPDGGNDAWKSEVTRRINEMRGIAQPITAAILEAGATLASSFSTGGGGGGSEGGAAVDQVARNAAAAAQNTANNAGQAASQAQSTANSKLSSVATDGTTITGDGTAGTPLSASGLANDLSALSARFDLGDHSTVEKWTGHHWIDGKKIYRKTIDCGELPSVAGSKIVDHGIQNIDNIMNAYGFTRETGGTTQMPLLVTGPYAVLSIGFTAHRYAIEITAEVPRPGSFAYITLLYTCTDR